MKILQSIIIKTRLYPIFRKLFHTMIVRTKLQVLARKLFPLLLIEFNNTSDYWQKRYVLKGNSGAGSFGRLAKFKAKVINEFVVTNDIKQVVELGCGDGNQLTYSNYPKYIGLDVSSTAIELCREKFKKDLTKSFYVVGSAGYVSAQLSLSLDVIFHLIEDQIYNQYMTDLFKASRLYVCIYSSNYNDDQADGAKHVRHRKFTEWINENAPEFELILTIPNEYPYDPNDPHNTSFADFFIFKRRTV